MSFLSETDTTLAELNDSLPRFYISEAVEETGVENTGHVLRGLSRMPESKDNTAGEGVKITKGKAGVTVIPSAHGKKLRVLSEARSMEAANELCDFVLRSIDVIMRSVDEN